LSDLRMSYFEDLVFLMGEVVPLCRARVDQSWPEYCNLQYCWRGPMYYAVDGGPETVLAGPQIFWHHPRHRYRYGPGDAASGWHHLWVTFRGPRARAIMEQGFMPLAACGYHTPAQPEPVLHLFGELVRRVRERPGQAQGECTVLLERILCLLQQPAEQPGRDAPHAEALLALAEEVRQAPYRAWDFAHQARRLHLSYSHFRRCFSALARHAPHEYLLLCRMQRAATELADPTVQIKTVALAAGYPDPAQFAKLFKRKMGLSPSQFRAALPGF